MFNDWNSKILPEEWKTLAYYSRLFCNIDLLTYCCAMVFYYPDIAMSYIGKPKESRKLLYQSYYPFDFQRSPVYEVLNMIQITQAIIMCAVDSLTKSLLVAMVIKHYINNLKYVSANIVTYMFLLDFTR